MKRYRKARERAEFTRAIQEIGGMGEHTLKLAFRIMFNATTHMRLKRLQMKYLLSPTEQAKLRGAERRIRNDADELDCRVEFADGDKLHSAILRHGERTVAIPHGLAHLNWKGDKKNGCTSNPDGLSQH